MIAACTRLIKRQFLDQGYQARVSRGAISTKSDGKEHCDNTVLLRRRLSTRRSLRDGERIRMSSVRINDER